MTEISYSRPVKLSIVIPCYNEEKLLEESVKRVLEIADDKLSLELVIVNDCSTDNSLAVAEKLAQNYPEIKLLKHEKNQGKGAALRTGFKNVTGEFVAIQDADLEYDPMDLRKLLVPLVEDDADVVLGSRFLSTGTHRVLYFWHSMGNRFLTFLSNMFTDLNLTDMETCYKIFRRDVIEQIEIEENRFGFEPEIVAKVAQMRLRIFEMGISYYGRTYAEGKKIGAKDGFRAIYCIIRYNANKAPVGLQFLVYFVIGAVAALSNLLIFLLLYRQMGVHIAAPIAFVSAALVNYVLCVSFLFRSKARWNTIMEWIMYILVVAFVCFVDLQITEAMLLSGLSPILSKITATVLTFILNFCGRRFLVFPEASSGDWQPQKTHRNPEE